jgi:catechol 2,3-dioxygenase-like lactoylglutathione lyase family enzyme
MRMHIGHVALRASDVERSATFLTDALGLRRTREADGAIWLSCNEKDHEVEYLPGGDRPGVDHLGLEVED